jgi:hypothetical protein
MATARAKSQRQGKQGGEPVTRVIRVSVSPDTWRKLRVQAAERDQPMTAFLGAILEREAGTRGDR